MYIVQRQILKVVDNWLIISTALATLHWSSSVHPPVFCFPSIGCKFGHGLGSHKRKLETFPYFTSVMVTFLDSVEAPLKTLQSYVSPPQIAIAWQSPPPSLPPSSLPKHFSLAPHSPQCWLEGARVSSVSSVEPGKCIVLFLQESYKEYLFGGPWTHACTSELVNKRHCPQSCPNFLDYIKQEHLLIAILRFDIVWLFSPPYKFKPNIFTWFYLW